MPDRDEEHDAFDLPFHAQSGNVDIGHLSENVQSEESRLRGIQGEGLNNALNNYYSGDATYSEFYSSLTELGYSEDRISDISDGAYIERQFRQSHTDGQGNPAPSDLSLNQLAYLRGQLRQGYDITNTNIHTDDDGRVFVDDYRTREDDGTPAKLYLPPAEQFDPLTGTQQSQIRIDERYLSHITLEEPSDRVMAEDNVDLQTRHQISQLVAQYLVRTSEAGNDQRREQLYRDIQNVGGLRNQRNIRPKLIQLFNDIAMEQQYRVENNGRPQGLTDTQWENIQDSPFYYGQVILRTDTEPPIPYIVSGQRYLEINDQGLETTSDRPLDYDNLSGDTQNQLNLYSTEFLTNTHIDPSVLSLNLLSTINYDSDNPADFRLRLQTEDLVNSLNQERIFRSQNNGRPSDISELQYEFMINHALQQGEPRYTGEPLIPQPQQDGTILYGFKSWDSNIPETILIPTDQIINQMIDSGVYTRPQPEEEPRPDVSPDDNLQPPRRPQIPPEGLPDLPPIPTADPSLAPPPDSEIRPSITGAGEPHLRPLPAGGEAPPSFDPPIIAGITQPINIRTGGDLPVDNLERNVARYQRFFNDNQEFFIGFREIFREILPVLSAGAGGYMTYLYEASKQKGTIQTIINQETQLLNELEGRIVSTTEDLQRQLTSLERRTITAEELVADIERIQARTDIIGGEGMRESLIRNRIRSLEDVSRLISRQRGIIENLQNEIKDTDIHTQAINNNIENLQNTNYEILNDLRSSAPKILMGVNIGYTLGLMLSGYLYPTYMNINEPYMTAENIEYTQTNINQDKNIKLEKSIIEEKRQGAEIPPTIKREYDAPRSKIIKPYQETFRPIKHGKRPLKYKEIQELKATLNPSELNNLKNKFLFFDNGKLNMEKSDDKCKNIIGETIISKRKVFI